MKRLTRALFKDRILKALVDKINQKLVTRTVPLQAELSHIRDQIEQAESRKRRYLDLIEQNNLDKSTVAERMQEIQADFIKFRAEKSRQELELTEGNSSPVSFEQVRELIQGFNQLLSTAPFEQRKTLLHLFIKRITVNTSKEIESIELSFDENADSYFSDSPVAVAAVDSFRPKQAGKREKIEIASEHMKTFSYLLTLTIMAWAVVFIGTAHRKHYAFHTTCMKRWLLNPCHL